MIDFIYKKSALTYADGDHAQKHFAGMEKAVRGIWGHSLWCADVPDEGEYDEGGDEVVGLVVEQVVHHPVRPLLRVADVRHFKPVTISHYVLFTVPALKTLRLLLGQLSIHMIQNYPKLMSIEPRRSTLIPQG